VEEEDLQSPRRQWSDRELLTVEAMVKVLREMEPLDVVMMVIVEAVLVVMVLVGVEVVSLLEVVGLLEMTVMTLQLQRVKK